MRPLVDKDCDTPRVTINSTRYEPKLICNGILGRNLVTSFILLLTTNRKHPLEYRKGICSSWLLLNNDLIQVSFSRAVIAKNYSALSIHIFFKVRMSWGSVNVIWGSFGSVKKVLIITIRKFGGRHLNVPDLLPPFKSATGFLSHREHSIWRQRVGTH